MIKVYESYIDEYKQKLKESYFYAKDTLFNRLYSFDDRGEFAIEVLDELLELQQRMEKATDKLKNMLPMCIMPNNMLIHGTEKAKVIEETLDILKGNK